MLRAVSSSPAWLVLSCASPLNMAVGRFGAEKGLALVFAIGLKLAWYAGRSHCWFRWAAGRDVEGIGRGLHPDFTWKEWGKIRNFGSIFEPGTSAIRGTKTAAWICCSQLGLNANTQAAALTARVPHTVLLVIFIIRSKHSGNYMCQLPQHKFSAFPPRSVYVCFLWFHRRERLIP